MLFRSDANPGSFIFTQDYLGVETTLAMRYGKGIAVADVWEGDYNMPVVLKSVRADCASLTDVRDGHTVLAPLQFGLYCDGEYSVAAAQLAIFPRRHHVGF